MSETIFEKIIKKEIPSDIVFENENVLAFKDINPQADVHLLFIHKEKSTDLNELMKKNKNHLIDLMEAITKYTEENGLKEKGYRLATNVGRGGGQSVFYTHFHVLCGSSMGSFGIV